MAYDPENPPSLIAQGVGGPAGLRWFSLMWTDTIADVLVPGYISNAADIGLRAGDGLIYKDTNRGEWDHYDLICLEVDEVTGAATLAFPEVPEEALPYEATIDPMLTSYAVLYYDGRQVRAPLEAAGSVVLPVASQAEAEAGTLNEKRMTPLRVFQGIAAYITGRAAKTPPVDADALVITDSADAGAPKRVTWANIKAALFTSIGALTGKTTPVDADTLVVSDSAASGVGKSLTWANVKATLKAYFDTLYPTYSEGTFAGTLTPGSGSIAMGNNSGFWTRQNKKISFTGYFDISSVSTPSGLLTLVTTGLPAPAGNSNGKYAAVALNAFGYTAGAYTMHARVEKNTDDIRIIHVSNTGDSAEGASTASLVKAGSAFIVSGFYFTD